MTTRYLVITTPRGVTEQMPISELLNDNDVRAMRQAIEDSLAVRYAPHLVGVRVELSNTV